jgi:phenylacetate-coenzyme A ligase PaaK-like adenylate-forming protein
VLLTTDHVPHAIVRELQHRWGCEVYNHYGMTEMGFGGGVECAAHFGYHMRELDLYFEIIDPHTGDPLPEGATGEVVFTTLTRRGMPLIRYRTGDFSRFLPQRCPCGTMLKSMERVKGRIDGRIKLAAGGSITMADLDEALFPIEGLLDFTATLSSEHPKDRLHIEAYVHGIHPEEAADAVRSALRAVPDLQMACERNQIAFAVDIRRESTVPLRGASKRSIVDAGRKAGRPCGSFNTTEKHHRHHLFRQADAREA